jgi:hypothetical protein
MRRHRRDGNALPPPCGRAIAYETSGCRGLIPPACGEGGWPKFFIWASRVGGSHNGSRACGGPPPRPPLSDDAAHRLRSADPPRKGEGFNSVTAQVTEGRRNRASILSCAIALPLRGGRGGSYGRGAVVDPHPRPLPARGRGAERPRSAGVSDPAHNRKTPVGSGRFPS